MQSRQTLAEAQMSLLKRELNFLLWTNDPPDIPEGTIRLVQSSNVPEPVHTNMQCVAHMVVASALFMHRGFKVTTRGGMAYVLDPSPDKNPENDWLNEIAKHWWLTVDGLGLVDLSLFGETENPLVYCNRSIGDRWQIHFSDNPEKLRAFLHTRERGCFYLTASKKSVTTSDLEQSLLQPVPSAKAIGIPLTYAHLVEHCEHLVAGSTQSLTRLSQKEAWQSLLD